VSISALNTTAGARPRTACTVAALGLMLRVEELVTSDQGPEEISEAFWQACHGGQRRTAEYLLRHGADINAIPGYAKQTALDIAVAPDTAAPFSPPGYANRAPSPPHNRVTATSATSTPRWTVVRSLGYAQDGWYLGCPRALADGPVAQQRSPGQRRPDRRGQQPVQQVGQPIPHG
jgi:ankyrin repeat protein